MDQLQQVFQPLTDQLPEGVRPYWWGAPVLAAILLLLLLWLLARMVRRLFTRRTPPPAAPENRLRETLAFYPPPATKPGERRLTVEGLPVRLRLVVLAPVGKDGTVDKGEVEELLGSVVHGLRKVIQEDQPRIRIWPPQLSTQGFAAVFHRLVLRPEPEGKPSRWILLAGQARCNTRPMLIGLALWADEPTMLTRRPLAPEDWGIRLRYETIPR